MFPIFILSITEVKPMPTSINAKNARLLPGLFKERADVNRAYLMELKTEDLLQNFYLEAGIRTDRDVTEMHLGWESPTCQLRGHFLGHWLSAASMLIARNNDRELKGKIIVIVDPFPRRDHERRKLPCTAVSEMFLRKLHKKQAHSIIGHTPCV